jgi:hypothetical protein
MQSQGKFSLLLICIVCLFSFSISSSPHIRPALSLCSLTRKTFLSTSSFLASSTQNIANTENNVELSTVKATEAGEVSTAHITNDAGDDVDLKAPQLATVPRPNSIANMFDEELRQLSVKMTRKMDIVIMPIMGILYILNYVDRSALAAAKVYGIMDDLGMTTQQFATAISILFVGYLPFQIPSNLIMMGRRQCVHGGREVVHGPVDHSRVPGRDGGCVLPRCAVLSQCLV